MRGDCVTKSVGLVRGLRDHDLVLPASRKNNVPLFHGLIDKEASAPFTWLRHLNCSGPSVFFAR